LLGQYLSRFRSRRFSYFAFTVEERTLQHKHSDKRGQDNQRKYRWQNFEPIHYVLTFTLEAA
jgi:hypothetical protein